MKKLLPILLIVLLATVAMAQNKGRMIGTITTGDGAVIEGVTITITSDALIANTMTTTTNDRGQFRFVLLPVGTFTIKFEKEGYKTIEQTEVKLSFEETLTLNKVMTPADFEEVVTITGEAPVVDKTSSAIGDKLDLEFLQNIPNTRNVWGMPNLSAGFTNDSAFGGVERAGQAYNTDGVNVSDPATGTVFSSINMESVEQVDVAMFGANAEYGAFTGASLNVVTKSGGNEFHGEANYFMQRVDWVDDNTTDIPGTAVTTPTASDLDDKNAALGGPLVKDKIWFFANGKMEDRTTEYGTLDGVVPQEETPRRYFGKISARWDDRNISYGSWINYTQGRSHRVAYGAWSTNHEDGLWKQESESDTYLLQHSFVFNDDIIFEGRFAGFRGGFDLIPRNEGPTIYNYDLGEYGHSLSRTDLYTRNRDNLLVTANYYNDDLNGSHSFKFGFEWERSLSARFYSHKERMYIRYGDWWRWYDYGEYDGGTVVFRLAGYAQDSWSVNDKLTINYGFRFDNSDLKPEKEAGGLANGTDTFMTVKDPAYRLGFAYDWAGDGKTVLRAFVGRYYEGVVSGNTEPMVVYVPPTYRYDWNGSQWNLVSISGGSDPDAYSIDPDIKNQYTEGFMFGVEREVMPGWAASFNFVYKWDRDMMGSVYPDSTWDTVNVNTQYYSGIFYDNVVISGAEYYTNPQKGDVGVLEDLERKYWALVFELTKRMSDNWSMRASYTYARNTGNVGNGSYGIIQGFSTYTDPQSYLNVTTDSRLWGDLPHNWKVSGTYIAPFDIYFSPAITYQSGRVYDVTTYVGNDAYAVPIEVNKGDNRYDDQLNIDLRVEKAFMIDRYRIGFIFDVFNALNSDAVTGHVSNVITHSRFKEPSSIVGARFYQAGIRVIF